MIQIQLVRLQQLAAVCAHPFIAEAEVRFSTAFRLICD